MSSLLFRHAVFPGRAAAAWPGRLGALLVEHERIAWAGPDREAPAADDVIDLEGALLLPAFTDAHVHVTETGLHLDGLDLSRARSLTEILDGVAAHARARPGQQVLGHGWDELELAEGRPPTAAELDRAGGGAQVYLSRVDVHSAIVSSSLIEVFDLRSQTGWSDTGRIERDAHHVARHATRFRIPEGRRRALQRRALDAAAAAGIGEVHEMSAPHMAPDSDLPMLLSPAEPGPVVIPYRGEAVTTTAEALAVGARLGLPRPLAGLAGDLIVDGSIGSRTACLAADYSDAPGERGHLYLSVREIRDHVVACTRAGLQAGFHVIGDGGIAAVLAGFASAASEVGLAALRGARHRLEHVETLDDDAVSELARLGLTASVQPAFDAAWGGGSGMYARRLGPERARRLNPFAAMVAAGIPLAFGSDAPITPFAPWEGVRAAMLHRTPEHRIGPGTAFHAHTAAATAAGDPPPAARGVPGLSAARVNSGRSDPGFSEPRRSEPGHREPRRTDTWRSDNGRDAGRDVAGRDVAGRDVAGRGGAGFGGAGHEAYGLGVGAPATFAVWDAGGTDTASATAEPLSAVAARLRAGEPVPTCLMTVVNGRIVFREN